MFVLIIITGLKYCSVFVVLYKNIPLFKHIIAYAP